MSLWMVRAGKHGEQEQGALEHSVVTIGWNELPDLSHVKNRDELAKLYAEVYPAAKKAEAANRIGQVWRFVGEIRKGDLVALPLKTQSAIAIGKVDSDYEYQKLTENIKHIRRVTWLKTLPRSAFPQDILYSLGAFKTVCQIERHDADNRVKRLLEGIQIPESDEEIEVVEAQIDVERYARDEIVKHLATKFSGHALARLVAAILHAQGYVTKVSPPGRDGGVDILAAPGPLGFAEPRLCVQVKSSEVDVKVLRELRGVMSTRAAQHGLLVAWGGFTGSCRQEARDAFFSIRLWDQDDLLDAVLEHYHQFDDELKAELPLKTIWALVREE